MDILNSLVIQSIEVILRYRFEQNASVNRLIDLRKLFLFQIESPDALHWR